MARRKDLFGAFVSAVGKEAKRSAREYERQQRIRQKEMARRSILNNKYSTLKDACGFEWRMEKHKIDFKSLKNNIPIENQKAIAQIKYFDILPDILSCIKIGDRTTALATLIANSALNYNEVLDLLGYLENNLYEYMEQNEEAWFEDDIGQYEFLSKDDIFQITEDIDYDTSKAEVSIECIPIDFEEIVTGKDPNVIQNRIAKTLKKVNDKWNTELFKYHEKRENVIVENMKRQLSEILNYDYINAYKF